MKRISYVLCAIVAPILCTLAVFAQTDSGSIAGVLSDPNGGPVALASVQLKNASTGAVYKATSSAKGSYSLTQLPSGEYTLTIPAVGFTLDRLERTGIVIRAGEALRLNISLNWGPNLGTPGDDVATLIRLKHPAPSGPVPRTAEGKPDLSGVWQNVPEEPGLPELLPWAAALVKERIQNAGKLHPSAFCLPGDVILFAPLHYKLVQTPSLLVILWEGTPGHHQVFLDGRSHSNNVNPTWMGDSLGRWEGDTLVVDTVGFNDLSWIGIAPHTERMHVIQRYRRIDLGHLEKDITLEDPGAFAKPWTMKVASELAPGEEVLEDVCSENNKGAAHLSNK